MNAMLMCGLLARATSSREGKLELPVETGADPAVSKVVDFLVEQGWLQKDGGDRTWTVTPSGRFCFESLAYGDIVTFYEYGGAVFLLCTRSNPSETIVWHRGRFATIGIAHFPHPEHFEIRKENEPVTTSASTCLRAEASRGSGSRYQSPKFASRNSTASRIRLVGTSCADS